jgi:hypothetical protein
MCNAAHYCKINLIFFPADRRLRKNKMKIGTKNRESNQEAFLTINLEEKEMLKVTKIEF